MGRYQDLLHPRLRDKRQKRSKRRHDAENDITTPRLQQQEAQNGTPTVDQSWPSKLTALHCSVHICSSRRHLHPKSTAQDSINQPVPRTRHSILHPSLPRPVRHLIFSIYDVVTILVLTLHIYVFLSSITSLMAFCTTQAIVTYPDWALPPIEDCPHSSDLNKTEHCRVLSMQERCERLNWNIHGAGGFSSAVAAVLAGIHVAALLCRVGEMCYTWIMLMKAKWKERNSEKRETTWDWHDSPRDIDIHTRGVASSTKEGRLTMISEEECTTGGKIRRRKEADGSDGNGNEQSKTSSGASGNLGDVLLACLVP
jgi:hypothetical protein